MVKDALSVPPTRALSWIAAIALGIPAIAAFTLSTLGSHDGSWLLTGLLTALMAISLAVSRTSSNKFANTLLVISAISVVTLWPEMGLRVLGLKAENAGAVVFGLVEPSRTIPAVHDTDLFWTLSPESPDVNEYGFPNSEFVIPKPKENYRIVFLGDSCTQQGYPKYVEQILNQPRSDGLHYESINLGIAGYTSHQGLVVARRWLAKLEPDLVVVYFGWNDHWQAVVATDAERSLWYRRMLVQFLSSSRLFQVGVWAFGPRTIKRIDLPRVSLAEYRANLTRIGELAQSVGADVLFLTAPSSHLYRGVPDYLVEQEFAPSKKAVTELHARYNLEVTNLATERGWRILDLQSEVQLQPDLAGYFLKDGIHFTNAGLSWIAERIVMEAAPASNRHATTIK